MLATGQLGADELEHLDGAAALFVMESANDLSGDAAIFAQAPSLRSPLHNPSAEECFPR